MKITCEFNTIDEIKNFVELFGVDFAEDMDGPKRAY